ncbi:DUF2271 domain-containing protein [Uliginosibacterium sediminicola]|uniref:DUF2271 domain-containing protein n=1 Tax=Uliginosibacterium sediminicola TaxID=2024550 RepID=A0ABU9YTM5_9RHOO
MKKSLCLPLLSALALVCSAHAAAAELQLDIQLPALQGARVKRPYVAIWLEKAGSHEFVGSFEVWYDTSKRNNAGTKWLPDLRSWWRASGGQAQLSLDAISSATRPAGLQHIELSSSEVLHKLPAGDYELVVEASREHGGDEALRLPLRWPLRGALKADANGTQELGRVSLSGKP